MEARAIALATGRELHRGSATHPRGSRRAETFSRRCRLALNLLKRDKSVKIGVHGKRIKAGWDEPYLLRLLTS
jgi:hypothetical protein